MKPLITIVTIFCCCSFNAYAQQNFGVKGSVTDTTSQAALNGATIAVISAKDSILQKFTYVNKGSFNISGLKPGNFLLWITCADYAEYVSPFTLDPAHAIYDFKTIIMSQKSKLLNEVIIRGKVVSMKLKGDTTEFNPKAYATQKNARVEDLLKLLPGMRVNQDGAIIFQGEKVNKILVDGEEFFGDDPTLVTKNIRVDMVKALQVYNQKSDQAKFTGIDDGVKIKTINVQLLEDKKRGVFGKLEAGKSNAKYYAAQAMANKFTPKTKFSVYGNIGNTGNVGLSGGDNGNYGGRFNFYGYNGIGIPFARDGGTHYDTKWNKERSSVNVTYKLGGLTIDQAGNTITQNNLPGNFNKSNRNKISHNYAFRQAADIYFTEQLDSTSTLSAQVSISTRYATSTSSTATATVRGNGILLNDNMNNSDNQGDFNMLSAYLRYVKKLRKAGRNIAVYSNTFLSEFLNNSYLRSSSNYYDAAGMAGTPQTIDQYKPNNTTSQAFTAGASYTEPVARLLSLTAGYGINRSASNSNQESFNKSATGRYELLDLLYSNNYGTIDLSNSYSVSANFKTGKFSASLSTNAAIVVLKQTDKILDTALSRDFTNWTHNANLFYQAGKAATFNLTYYGFTRQPLISQIQPVRQNSDPLNIIIGNSGLIPEFNNSLSFKYRLYQAASDRGVTLNVNYNDRINAIINNRVTDSTGVNTYQAANLTGRKPVSWNIYLELYGHAAKVDFDLSPNISLSGNTYYSYINKQLNKTRSISYKPAIELRKNKPGYSYSLGLSATFTRNSTSLQELNNDTRRYNADFNLFTKLPFNFFMGGSGNYEFTAKNQVFKQDFSRFILKAYLGKKFLKEEQLKITITGNDLLDQNTGYSRNGDTDSYTEERNNVIRRYFMFSVSWDFSKFGTLKKS